MKVIPGAGEVLQRSERGAERTDTATAGMAGSASQTEGLLWLPAVTGDSIEPVDLGNVHGTVPHEKKTLRENESNRQQMLA